MEYNSCLYEMTDEDLSVNENKIVCHTKKIEDVKKNFFNKETILLVFTPSCPFCTTSINILKKIIDEQQNFTDFCNNFNIVVYNSKQNQYISKNIEFNGVPMFLSIDKNGIIQKDIKQVGLPGNTPNEFIKNLMKKFG